MIKRFTLFIACFLSAFLLKASHAETAFNCSVWLDTIGNNCLMAVPDGTAPYTYQWDDGSQQNTYCFSAISNPTVCVTISDATGCVATACYTIPPACSVFIYVAGNPTSGNFLQAATTGTGNLSYQWSTGENTSSINPTNSGTYCCTITDSNGCSAEDCITYEVTNNNCSVTIDSTIQGGNCLQAIPSGTAPYTYQWSDGSLQSMICMLNSGTQYCVTITDANGCTASECAGGVTLPSCGVDVYINNILGAPLPILDATPWGTAPFTFNWSSGETTQSISPQNGPGTYCVTITDNNGCTSNNCVTVSLNSCTVGLVSVQNGSCFQAIGTGAGPFTYSWSDGTVGDVACTNSPGMDSICVTMTDVNGCVATACSVFGNSSICDVTIDLDAAGTLLSASATGTSFFTYQWSTGEIAQSIYPNGNGTYCVTITDGTGCTADDCIDFVMNNSCAFNLEYFQGGTCLEAEPIIGISPFTYSWSDGSTGQSVCYNPLSADSLYCVTITDATGCTAEDCGILNNTTFTCDVSIDFDTAGSVFTLQAYASGIAPFTYAWSTNETTQNISITTGGTFCVTITDNNGCSADACVTIPLNTNCAVDLNIVQNGSCVEPIPTGTAPFTYAWSDGSTGNIYCSNTPGLDSVCVTMIDANGCVTTACELLGNGTNNCSVSIDLDNTNGYSLVATPTGTAPFTYNWSNGANTSNITVTSIGVYDVSVTDATGCVSAISYSLQCLSSTAYIDFDSTATGNTTFTASVANGYSPYTYLWNTNETTASIMGNTNQYYSVTVTDALGCNIIGDTYNCWVYIDSIGGLMLSAVNSGIAPYTYQWSTGETSPTITGMNNTFYSVTVTDAQGCVANNWITLHCGGVQISPSGNNLVTNSYGVAPFSYLWNTGETTSSITPTTSQLYAVTVTDADGCTSTDTYDYNFSNDIFGNVYLDSVSTFGVVVSARVYLIQHDASVGTLTAIDSLDVSSTPNSFFNLPFSFTNLPNGDYLLKAALLPGSASYENFLPTYHENVLYWSDAVTVTTPLPPTLFPPAIYMVAGNNPGGPGFIGGLISEGANFTAGGHVDTRGVGDPVPNVNVLLLTENDEPVTHTLSNVDGEFEFPNLAWGTYKVVVEILGKDPGVKIVTIGPNEPTANIDFSVNETFVTGIEDVLNGASVKVFPNPVDDVVNLQLDLKENTSLNVNVINLLGKMLISENENLSQGINNLSINIKDLPTGVYFLNLSDGVEVISKKIIKN